MQLGFTATQHALLFAWIARAVIQCVGEEKGETAIRQAIQRYGEQRGRRMALRAQANGHALTMANYMAYGEWRAGSGEMEQKIVEKVPHAKVIIARCPWYRAWEENDLIPYGRFYCLEIDQALMHGFNPDLKLDVNSTRPNGGIQCEFVFRDAGLNLVNLLALAYRKVVNPVNKAVMPREYHIGHLYKTMSEVVVQELGPAGQEAISAALAELAGRYGDEAAQVIVAYQATDFDRLSD